MLSPTVCARGRESDGWSANLGQELRRTCGKPLIERIIRESKRPPFSNINSPAGKFNVGETMATGSDGCCYGKWVQVPQRTTAGARVPGCPSLPSPAHNGDLGVFMGCWGQFRADGGGLPRNLYADGVFLGVTQACVRYVPESSYLVCRVKLRKWTDSYKGHVARKPPSWNYYVFSYFWSGQHVHRNTALRYHKKNNVPVSN